MLRKIQQPEQEEALNPSSSGYLEKNSSVQAIMCILQKVAKNGTEAGI